MSDSPHHEIGPKRLSSKNIQTKDERANPSGTSSLQKQHGNNKQDTSKRPSPDVSDLGSYKTVPQKRSSKRGSAPRHDIDDPPFAHSISQNHIETPLTNGKKKAPREVVDKRSETDVNELYSRVKKKGIAPTPPKNKRQTESHTAESPYHEIGAKRESSKDKRANMQTDIPTRTASLQKKRPGNNINNTRRALSEDALDASPYSTIPQKRLSTSRSESTRRGNSSSSHSHKIESVRTDENDITPTGKLRATEMIELTDVDKLYTKVKKDGVVRTPSKDSKPRKADGSKYGHSHEHQKVMSSTPRPRKATRSSSSEQEGLHKDRRDEVGAKDVVANKTRLARVPSKTTDRVGSKRKGSDRFVFSDKSSVSSEVQIDREAKTNKPSVSTVSKNPESPTEVFNNDPSKMNNEETNPYSLSTRRKRGSSSSTKSNDSKRSSIFSKRSSSFGEIEGTLLRPDSLYASINEHSDDDDNIDIMPTANGFDKDSNMNSIPDFGKTKEGNINAGYKIDSDIEIAHLDSVVASTSFEDAGYMQAVKRRENAKSVNRFKRNIILLTVFFTLLLLIVIGVAVFVYILSVQQQTSNRR